MRRRARALSVAALAGVVLGFAASAVFAEPAAEVSPGSVSPGGSVTVSVSCDAADGSAPATLDATSQAFEEGTVELKRVSGNDEKNAGPAYSGTARIPPAENFEGDPDAAGPDSAWTVDGTCPAAAGGEGKPWSATFTVALDSGGGTGGKDAGKDGGKDAGKDGDEEGGMGGGTGGSDGGHGGIEGGQGGMESDQGGMESGQGGWEGGIGGTDGGGQHCADPGSDMTEPGMTGPGKGEPGKAKADCADEATHHGVRAGSGGTFTDSVPALVAGGVLIAGAAGGAVYRLRRKTPTAQV
ncbi:hypothetical protein [Streptomyces sp. AC550_RSS872]|uniref:hypothetical protein n=1 Tax=Streptomyces sp. AC550_RSS872 TaxID=2823689 RepID=UPI001C258077|nr:hypothetical protein [Streptomyces sp. AC550_RSS872]